MWIGSADKFTAIVFFGGRCNSCLGDYLRAAPSFVIPNLSTASAFSPSTNDVSAPFFVGRPLFSKKGRSAGASRADANSCLGDYLLAAPSFVVPRLSITSAFSPSTTEVSTVFFFWRPLFSKKNRSAGTSGADANSCLGDYLWAAPSFVVPNLSPAHAFIPSTNDVSAFLFIWRPLFSKKGRSAGASRADANLCLGQTP